MLKVTHLSPAMFAAWHQPGPWQYVAICKNSHGFLLVLRTTMCLLAIHLLSPMVSVVGELATGFTMSIKGLGPAVSSCQTSGYLTALPVQLSVPHSRACMVCTEQKHTGFADVAKLINMAVAVSLTAGRLCMIEGGGGSAGGRAGVIRHGAAGPAGEQQRQQ